VVKRALSRGYLGLILVFLYAPILVLIAFSFNSIRSMSKWGGFSFRWYTELFQNDTIMSALWVTVSVAVIAAIVATALGTLAAIGIHGYRRRTQNLVLNVTYLPILNPDIVTGLSLMLLFLFVGLPRGYFTLVLAHITFNIPYVILSVLPKLRQMDPNLYEAALDLGATPGYALRRVIIPEIMPGIVTGALLALTLSLDDFVISLFTQTGTSNISILVYSMARRSINPQINALSTLLFVAVLALLFIVNLRASKDDIAKETQR
jgi:spermidine/putrescine transport system permease protein